MNEVLKAIKGVECLGNIISSKFQVLAVSFGNEVTPNEGILCRNFLVKYIPFGPCLRAWCSKRFRVFCKISYLVQHLIDEEGEVITDDSTILCYCNGKKVIFAHPISIREMPLP